LKNRVTKNPQWGINDSRIVLTVIVVGYLAFAKIFSPKKKPVASFWVRPASIEKGI
jgi:hypothetical protein